MEKWLLIIICCSLAFAADFYVDIDATGANEGTSWQDAWQTFSDINWNNINPGDTIYISGDNSKTYPPLIVPISGEDNSPITIRAGQDEGHNGIVIFDAQNLGPALRIDNRQNLVIDGEYNGQKHLKFYRGKLSDGYDALISAYGANKIIYRFIEIEQAATGIRQNGQMSGYTSEFDNLHIHDIRGQCVIDLTFATGQIPVEHGHFLIHNSTFEPVWEIYNSNQIKGPDGIQATGSVYFYDNKVTGIRGSPGITVGGQHPDMLQSQNDYWKIFNNHFMNIGDSAIDFDLWSPHHMRHVWIYNNIFSIGSATAVWPQGIRIYDSMGSVTDIDDLLIANNAFVDMYNHYPLRLSSNIGDAVLSNVIIKNNIFFNSGGGTGYATDCQTISGSSQQDWNFDYNLMSAGTHGSAEIQLDGTSYTQPNSITGIPIFASYTEKNDANDYHLLEGSAGIDQGTDLSAYFTADRDGNERTGLWDVGPYEYSGCNTLTFQQLIILIDGWRMGTKNINEVMQSIKQWKSGC